MCVCHDDRGCILYYVHDVICFHSVSRGNAVGRVSSNSHSLDPTIPVPVYRYRVR